VVPSSTMALANVDAVNNETAAKKPLIILCLSLMVNDAD